MVANGLKMCIGWCLVRPALHTIDYPSFFVFLIFSGVYVFFVGLTLRCCNPNIISILNLNTGMFFICTISSTLWRLWWCQKWKSRPRSTGWRWAQWHSPERLLLQPPCRPPTPPGCAATVLLSPTGEVPQLKIRGLLSRDPLNSWRKIHWCVCCCYLDFQSASILRLLGAFASSPFFHRRPLSYLEMKNIFLDDQNLIWTDILSILLYWKHCYLLYHEHFREMANN